MGLFFNSKKHLKDADPRKPLTRYKQVHVRNAPIPEAEGMIDPFDRHTRMEPRHVRKPVLETPRFAATATPKPRRSAAADLHATDPISTNVLHRALPMRTAALDH